MQQLDDVVGALLKKIDDLGIADNTIVVFSTDNGAEKFTWPDGGDTPFRGEKGSTWEGGMRVPCVVRWPGVVKPGTVINGIMSHEDWTLTLLAAAGEPDVKEKLMKGHTANGKTFKVHLDGYDQRELLAGTGPRQAATRSSTSTTTGTSTRCAFGTGRPTSRSLATGSTVARRCP